VHYQETFVRDQLVRQWQIVVLLSEHRLGLRSIQIAEKLGTSRPSVDRDLRVLRSAGVQITTETVSGEKRHRFASKPLPPLQPTALQLAALQLARTSLVPLEGSRILREIDALLADGHSPQARLAMTVRSGLTNPDVVNVLDSAIEHRRRVRLKYAAASRSGQMREYEVDPLSLRLIKQDLYLGAYDWESRSAHRFKVLRVREATFLDQEAGSHPELDDAALFGRGIKVWAGEVQKVVVALRPEVAHLAKEYPLASDQVVEQRADGCAHISANVSGLVEAKQWVLGWGSSAKAIEPPALREAVRTELMKAVADYLEPDPQPTPSRARRGPALATARRADVTEASVSQQKG
jgi:predicted DNA-binding transcriptional regulator YafY